MRKRRREVTQKNAEGALKLRDALGPNGSISITSILETKQAATLWTRGGS
jgi:hypothetical protein